MFDPNTTALNTPNGNAIAPAGTIVDTNTIESNIAPLGAATEQATVAPVGVATEQATQANLSAEPSTVDGATTLPTAPVGTPTSVDTTQNVNTEVTPEVSQSIPSQSPETHGWYRIIGLVDAFDEQGNIVSQYPIGSRQLLKKEYGDRMVVEGQVEIDILG